MSKEDVLNINFYNDVEISTCMYCGLLFVSGGEAAEIHSEWHSNRIKRWWKWSKWSREYDKEIKEKLI